MEQEQTAGAGFHNYLFLYETLLTAEVFFCTQHCPSFYLPPDTAWLQGRSTESSYHHYVGAGD